MCNRNQRRDRFIATDRVRVKPETKMRMRGSAIHRNLRYGADTAASPATSTLKFQPPRLTNTVLRRRLLTQLDASQNRKLVAICAPRGYGKTTLLAQWYRQRNDASLAWLTLDEMDADPQRFLEALEAALRVALPAPQDADNSSPNEIRKSARRCADAVRSLLAASAGSMTVMVDDCHVLDGSECLSLLSDLVRHSPHQVRWVFAGEGLAGFDCSELKLRDEFTLFDPESLRFAPDEIQQLSRKLGRSRSKSLEAAEHLCRRTEGWAAAVKFALLSAPKADVTSWDISGSSIDLAQFFSHSVWARQGATVQNFLLTSSILDRLHRDLCDTLVQCTGGQSILERLHAAQVFLQPADSERNWYRLHPLFREYLFDELRRRHPERIASLHTAASRWLASHQLLDASLAHAFAGSDREWCIELIAGYSRHWLKSGEIDKLLEWIAKLSDEEIMRRHGIATAYIAALIFRREFNAAAAALRNADRALNADAALCADDRARSRLHTLRLMLDVLADADDFAACELSEPSVSDNYLSGTLLALQAYWMVRRGNFEGGRLRALRARDILERRGSKHDVGYADVVLCIADRALGDLESVVVRCEQMFAAARHSARGPAWINAATSMAYLRYEQNRLPESEQLYREVMPHLTSASSVETLTNVYATLARIMADSERTEEALRLLDRLHVMLDASRQRRCLAVVCYEKVRIHLAGRNVSRASSVASDFGLADLASRGHWDNERCIGAAWDAAWERLGLAHAALLQRAGRHLDCRRILETLITAAHRFSFAYRITGLEAALAVCEWGAENHVAAFAALNRAWSRTRRFGLTRNAFDEAPGVGNVLTAALKQRELAFPVPAKYLDKYGSAVTQSSGGLAAGAVRYSLQIEPLTEREVDMLRLLARGFSNQQIGKHSNIALSTAKWHLKNLFAKLDVGSRTGAIARARELQLID